MHHETFEANYNWAKCNPYLATQQDILAKVKRLMDYGKKLPWKRNQTNLEVVAPRVQNIFHFAKILVRGKRLSESTIMGLLVVWRLGCCLKILWWRIVVHWSLAWRRTCCPLSWRKKLQLLRICIYSHEEGLEANSHHKRSTITFYVFFLQLTLRRGLWQSCASDGVPLVCFRIWEMVHKG